MVRMLLPLSVYRARCITPKSQRALASMHRNIEGDYIIDDLVARKKMLDNFHGMTPAAVLDPSTAVEKMAAPIKEVVRNSLRNTSLAQIVEKSVCPYSSFRVNDNGSVTIAYGPMKNTQCMWSFVKVTIESREKGFAITKCKIKSECTPLLDSEDMVTASCAEQVRMKAFEARRAFDHTLVKNVAMLGITARTCSTALETSIPRPTKATSMCTIEHLGQAYNSLALETSIPHLTKADSKCTIKHLGQAYNSDEPMERPLSPPQIRRTPKHGNN